VKRSTAIRHLVETAEVARDLLRFRNSDIGWPLEELWVTGDLLGFAEDVDAGSVVLTLDVQPEEMPWLAINASGEWVGDQLRLGKRPLLWCYRPKAWPMWNHEHRRVVRYWSAAEGLHGTVIEALRVRRFEQLDIARPSLWRAATTVSEMHDALEELETSEDL
jgi:hypothetical protein